MSRASLRGTVLVFLMLVGPVSDGRTQSFDLWFDKKISDTLDALQVGQNGKGADKQHESPAGDTRSTSLVDQTSSTDFVSAAVNLATVASGQSTNAPASGSQTVTASLYALLAGLSGNAPTDPQFYAEHVDARRASFTIGTAASNPKTDNSDAAATVVGGKLLLINGRELYRQDNLSRIRDVQKRLSDATKAGAILKRRIQEILFLALHATDGVKSDGSIDPIVFGTFLANLTTATFPTVLSSVSPGALKKVDAEIMNALSVFASLRDSVQHTYESIQKGAQLAVLYTATVRKADGFNNHRGEIAYDYGLSSRVTWTANGSVDYVDKKASGSATFGRVATEFVGDLTSSGDGWSKEPIRLSFSGAVNWASGESTSKSVQAKLTIPIASGFNLPLVYRYGKPNAQSTSGSEARVGFSVDISRLLQAAR